MKIRNFVLGLATAAAIAAPTLSARAADVPPPPVDDLRGTYDWTGLYAGLWGGLACIDGGSVFDNTTSTSYDLSGCGGKAGVMGGYNYQIDQIVLGVEGDFGWGSNMVKNTDPTANFGYDLKNIATIRGRVGYALDNTLLFVTGGAAWAKGDLYGLSGGLPPHTEESQWGWTIGGGIEEAITDNFHLRLDYLYTHMSSQDYSSGCCDLNVDWHGEHEFRLGAIWSFGTF